jgi:hypothetical protein
MRMPIIASLFVISLLGCGRTPRAVSERPASYDPLLVRLIEMSGNAGAPGKEEENSGFVDALMDLAGQKGWVNIVNECNRRVLCNHPLEGRTETLSIDDDHYVLVILRWWDFFIPGRDFQLLLLIDENGRLLDHVSCEINSRLTQMWWGKYVTEVLNPPGEDGARLVIRLILPPGDSVCGNFSHLINYQGRDYEFYWGNNENDLGQPTIWDQKGLSRLTVENDKFKVLFPSLKEKP